MPTIEVRIYHAVEGLAGQVVQSELERTIPPFFKAIPNCPDCTFEVFVCLASRPRICIHIAGLSAFPQDTAFRQPLISMGDYVRNTLGDADTLVLDDDFHIPRVSGKIGEPLH